MHFIYGKADGSANSVKLYKEKYPTRRHPSDKKFTDLHRRLRESGSVYTLKKERGCTTITDTEKADLEESVIEMIEENPRVSIRDIARRIGLPLSEIWRIITDEGLHPYHILRVQHLLDEDFARREEFSTWMQNNQQTNRFILYTDEAQFTRHGFSNIHNDHLWSRENPRATVVRSFQERFSINVWCGIVDDKILGPHIFDASLNGEKYLHFLKNDLPLLIQNLDEETRNNLWYMHDGAPAHRTRLVTQHLNNTFPNRWIGYNSPVVLWPARSPDLTPCDFSLWGRLKTCVYQEDITTKEQLTERIMAAFDAVKEDSATLRRTTESVIKRTRVCLENFGGYIENQL